MGSLAEETPEDRRPENQSESHRTVIPPDGELRRDSDDILRVHAVHPKRDPRCLARPTPTRAGIRAEGEVGAIGRTNTNARIHPGNPSRGSMEAVPQGLTHGRPEVRDLTTVPPSDVSLQMNQFLHSAACD